MSEELKCCPFCGGEAIRGLDEEGSPYMSYHVYCENCLAQTAFCDSFDVADELWNTRPTEANCQKKLDGSKGDKSSPVELVELGKKECGCESIKIGVDCYSITLCAKHARTALGRGTEKTDGSKGGKVYTSNLAYSIQPLETFKSGRIDDPNSWDVPESSIGKEVYEPKLHIDYSDGYKPFLAIKPKHIDPKEYPLTPDMVGRVVLVSKDNTRRLLDVYYETRLTKGDHNVVMGLWDEYGVFNIEKTRDSDDIKYYYFIR